MKYDSVIQDSLVYIQEHIEDKLTVEKIAAHVGYSPFHFCRIFALTQNMTVKEYVRKCRLNLARKELNGENKILDVAISYGFATASGFTKSFHKEFGYTPTSYIVRMMDVNDEFIHRIEDIIEEPQLLYKEAFKVAGYGTQVNLSDTYNNDLAAYWDHYEEAYLEEKMYRQLKPPKHGEVGVCIPNHDSEQATYLFGVVVDDFSRMTKDMLSVTIPEGLYAVFQTPPINNVKTADTYDKDPLSIAVKETWRYIFTTWIKQSAYVLDESRMSYEYYDERCHGLEDAIMEIYVPLKKEEG